MSRRFCILVTLAVAALAVAGGLRACGGAETADATGAPDGESAVGSAESVESSAAARRTTLPAARARRAPLESRDERQNSDADGTPATAPFISGTVRAEDGSAVAGAFVVLGDLDDSDYTTITGADGSFAIDEVPSYSSVHAAAVRDDRVWVGTEPADGGPFQLDVVLEPPNELAPVVLVRVRGHDGKIVPQAQVHAVSGIERKGIRHRGDCRAAGGWFAVSARRWRNGETPVFVVSEARDADGNALPYGPALVRVDPFGPPVVDVTLPEERTLSGHVSLPDGSPAAATNVELAPSPPEGFDPDTMTPPRELTTATDPEGAFSFRGLASGGGVIRVDPVAMGDASSGPVAVVPDGRHVAISLRRAVPVTVCVRDDAGHAVAGVGVALRLRDEDWTVRAITAADGEVALGEFPEGAAADVWVGAQAIVARRSAVLLDGSKLVMSVECDAQIEGRVIGPDGEPIEHAPLRVEPGGASSVEWHGWGFVVRDVALGDIRTLSLVDDGRVLVTVRASGGDDDLTLRWPNEPDRLTLALPDFASGTTATFRAEGRLLGSITARAAIVSLESAALPDRCDVQVGPTDDGTCALLRGVPRHGFLRVRPTKTERLNVRVRAPGDVPAAFATCVATVDDAFVVTFEANDDGVRAVQLPAGRIVVSATARGGLTGSVEVEEGSRSVELVLSRR